MTGSSCYTHSSPSSLDDSARKGEMGSFREHAEEDRIPGNTVMSFDKK